MKIREIKGRVLKVPRFPYRWRDGFPQGQALHVLSRRPVDLGNKLI